MDHPLQIEPLKCAQEGLGELRLADAPRGRGAVEDVLDGAQPVEDALQELVVGAARPRLSRVHGVDEGHRAERNR